MLRIFLMLISVCLFLLPINNVDESNTDMSIIIEVEGSPQLYKKRIEANYPFIEVVATYDVLFQGLALKGDAKKLAALADMDFVTGTYPVETYHALKIDTSQLDQSEKSTSISLPSDINPTDYTGKGVKVAVIDTGIDYHHPDLQEVYKGGFDLVDLDDIPMETTGDLATYHGTHVAGIIAANGELKGVAPDSDIYAYRALGPGGSGTSIQVIAAMEEAVKEGVDVMNLSLGNIVNGPDYPTSKAVNEAAEQGIAVIVANGNAGPENWTVGAPATASSAFSVGALQPEHEQPVLYDIISDKTIGLKSLIKFGEWGLNRDYQITDTASDARDKIGFLSLTNQNIKREIENFTTHGAIAMLIEISEVQNVNWLNDLEGIKTSIPIALVTKNDGEFIQNMEHTTYVKTKYMLQDEAIANFSSRGPVTVNWMMKPDIIAPGVNIMSTVPEGYTILNGTSMAAPHVAGAVAVMKEAHPDWPNEQIFGALKTTAAKIPDTEPIEQGAGNIQLKAALHPETIIDNPQLSFGKINEHINERTIPIAIENMTNKIQSYRFNIPNNMKGITWDIPLPFTLKPGKKLELPITANFNTLELEEGIIQGWIELKGEEQDYSLPYMAVNKTADFPRVMGFEFSIAEGEDGYAYSLYVSEKVNSATLKLYDPDTLSYEGDLWTWEDLEIGMNEGVLNKTEIDYHGNYYGLLLVEDKNGEYSTYETEVQI